MCWPGSCNSICKICSWEYRIKIELLQWNLLKKFLTYNIYRTLTFWRVKRRKSNLCIRMTNQKGLPGFNVSFLLFLPEWIRVTGFLSELKELWRSFCTARYKRIFVLRPQSLQSQVWRTHGSFEFFRRNTEFSTWLQSHNR